MYMLMGTELLRKELMIKTVAHGTELLRKEKMIETVTEKRSELVIQCLSITTKWRFVSKKK